MRIIDRTRKCIQPTDRLRVIEDITTIIFHRIMVAPDAVGVAQWFAERPHLLGTPSMPYTFIITKMGIVEQALPLKVRAPHAWTWNSRAIGVGVIGDFRVTGPSPQQYAACAGLAVRLQDQLHRPLHIAGHTHLEKATKQTDKVCPGDKFIIDAVRESVGTEGRIIIS